MTCFLLAVAGYLIGLSSLAALFFFLQFGSNGNPGPFTWGSVLFNSGLFLIFPLQHSILARPAVKRAIQRLIPPSLERAFYVATSGLALWPVLLLWQPMGPLLYHFQPAWPFRLVFYTSLILIIWTTRVMDHMRMFGVKQGYAAWKQYELPAPVLRQTGIFSVVRHPLTSLLIVALWAHESATMSRLLFNAWFTVYALIGTVFEERDLSRMFGAEFTAYRSRVPGFIPRWKR